MLAHIARARAVLGPGLKFPSSSPALRQPCLPRSRTAAARLSSTARANVPTSVYIDRVAPGTDVNALKEALPFHVASVSPTEKPTLYRAMFESPEAASAAIAAHKAEPVVFGGKLLALDVERAPRNPSPDLHVSGFPDGTTEAELADALGVAPDAVLRPRLGKHKMFAHVRLGTVAAATAVLARLAAAPPVVGENTLRVTYAGEARKPRAEALPDAPSPWVYVSGFPGTTSREDIAAALGVTVNAVSDLLVSSRGPYAFVKLPSPDAAEELLHRYTDKPTTLGGLPLALGPGGLGPPQRSRTLMFTGLSGNTALLRSLLAPYKGTFDSSGIRGVAGQRSHTALFVDFVDVETAQQVRGEVSGTALPGGLVVKAVNARPSQFERKTSDAGKSMTDGSAGSAPRGRTLAFTGFGGSKDTLRSLLTPYADAFNIRGVAGQPSSDLLFADFSSDTTAAAARKQLAGTVLPDGRAVMVRYASPPRHARAQGEGKGARRPGDLRATRGPPPGHIGDVMGDRELGDEIEGDYYVGTDLRVKIPL